MQRAFYFLAFLTLAGCGMNLSLQQDKLNTAQCQSMASQVQQKLLSVQACTQDSDCTFTGGNCGNFTTIYNRNSDFAGYQQMSTSYERACNVAHTLQCESFSGRVSCQQGLCKEAP